VAILKKMDGLRITELVNAVATAASMNGHRHVLHHHLFACEISMSADDYATPPATATT
jgi:hypothetical protein